MKCPWVSTSFFFDSSVIRNNSQDFSVLNHMVITVNALPDFHVFIDIR